MSDQPTINSGGIYLHKWVLPIILTLLLVAGAAWTGVLVQARNALPRVEAAEVYVGKADYYEDQRQLNKRLERIENKLDRLLERQ